MLKFYSKISKVDPIHLQFAFRRLTDPKESLFGVTVTEKIK